MTKVVCPQCEPLERIPYRLRPHCDYCHLGRFLDRSTDDAMRRLQAMVDAQQRRRVVSDTLH